MTTFAVIGASGTVGHHIVEVLIASGAVVRQLGRSSASHPVDLTTGAGLADALVGADVVIDAANGSPRRPEPVLVDGAGHLVAAAAAAQIAHLVCVSIVGIERAPGGYYRAKLEQEAIVKRGPVPWTIVRSTQFHELVDAALSALGRWRLSPRSAAQIQPVAAAQAGAIVAEIAGRPPARRTVTIGGPQICDVSTAARSWAQTHGRWAVPLPVPLPPSLGRPLRDGVLTCPDPDHRATITFRQWLTTHR